MALKLPEGGAQPTHEPNVVPMIDILLVLLIIFMMQVPLSRKAMDVQVPPDIRKAARRTQQQHRAGPQGRRQL
jgi:biopolymer transport protein ExbD